MTSIDRHYLCYHITHYRQNIKAYPDESCWLVFHLWGEKKDGAFKEQQFIGFTTFKGQQDTWWIYLHIYRTFQCILAFHSLNCHFKWTACQPWKAQSGRKISEMFYCGMLVVFCFVFFTDEVTLSIVLWTWVWHISNVEIIAEDLFRLWRTKNGQLSQESQKDKVKKTTENWRQTKCTTPSDDWPSSQHSIPRCTSWFLFL